MISEKDTALEVRKFIVGPLKTNCYVLHERLSRKGVLIDPGAYDPAIASYIKDRKVDISCILNTHGHADHILGNTVFGFPVLIHELDVPCLQDFMENRPSSGGNMRPVGVGRLLKDGDTLHLGAVKLEIIHTPGHTPGSVSVKYRTMLFSGDVLFFEGIGRTDLPGGDYETLIKSIKEKLLVFPDFVKIFPGHGPETTVGHERRNNPFLM